MPVSSTDALVDFALTAPAPASGDATVRTLVDTVGVALPGFETDVLDVLMRWAARQPVPGGATVWGRADGASAARAALINGTAAHALDFDDAAPSMPMHPSAVLWPALLAWADVHGGDGTSLLRAFDVGQAAFRAIGESLPMDAHYPRGWHSTSTIGHIAATAALISLGGVDEDTARHALGIAATTASGSIANFGSMTKPLHAGLAAQDAVTAVELALAGLTANPEQLDHPKGYFALFGDRSRSRGDIGERLEWWRTEWTKDLSVKQYPSCYGTHRAVDAAIDARDDLGDAVQDFASIAITVHPSGLDPLISGQPTSGLEGKFSLPYTVVRALLDGRLGLDSFQDDDVTHPTTVELMSRVTVRTAPAPEDRPELESEPFTDITIIGRDGVVARRLVTLTLGDARRPLSDDQIDAKFLSCAGAAGWSEEASHALLAEIRRLPSSSDLTSLTRALHGPTGSTRVGHASTEGSAT
jgi:2-methylcitrate dehydratase PrpD